MAKKTKKEVSFGGYIVCAGCLIRIVQLLGAFFGAGFVSNRWLYVSMLCLLCGGFALISYEKKGKASLTAIITSAACLLSTVMGNMSDGGDALRVASAIFLVLSFAAAGFNGFFASNGKAANVLCGIALIVLAIFCGVFAFAVAVAPWITLLVLCTAYILMGVVSII